MLFFIMLRFLLCFLFRFDVVFLKCLRFEVLICYFLNCRVTLKMCFFSFGSRVSSFLRLCAAVSFSCPDCAFTSTLGNKTASRCGL